MKEILNIFFSVPKRKFYSPDFRNESGGDKIIISVERFLQMYKNDPDSLKDAKMIPPSIGDSNFGYFELQSKNDVNSFELIDE